MPELLLPLSKALRSKAEGNSDRGLGILEAGVVDRDHTIVDGDVTDAAANCSDDDRQLYRALTGGIGMQDSGVGEVADP